MNDDPYLPRVAKIVARDIEAKEVVTLHLSVAADGNKVKAIKPGQFNMLYAYGYGEVPISVVSEPHQPGPLAHTIRQVGYVTDALCHLDVGDEIGIRGPFGQGWPLEKLQGKEIIILTGGLGSAPVISGIDYLFANQAQYGAIHILHGVKAVDEFIYKDRYQRWQTNEQIHVSLACDSGVEGWHHGLVTDLIDDIPIKEASNVACIICGPRFMMQKSVAMLMQRGISDHDIYVSLERNMQCGLGHCGHCQCGDQFVCQDGPVFSWHDISPAIAYGQ